MVSWGCWFDDIEGCVGQAVCLPRFCLSSYAEHLIASHLLKRNHRSHHGEMSCAVSVENRVPGTSTKRTDIFGGWIPQIHEILLFVHSPVSFGSAPVITPSLTDTHGGWRVSCPPWSHFLLCHRGMSFTHSKIQCSAGAASHRISLEGPFWEKGTTVYTPAP